MLPNETVSAGAAKECADCKEKIVGPKVMFSPAGYYIGYTCGCGPYSRESGYIPTAILAKQILEGGVWERR
jgi:hypothetical protein